MSLLKRPTKSLKLRKILSDDGLKKAKYNSKQLSVAIDDTSSQPTINPKLSTVVSLLPNKKKISTDKSSLCDKNIPNTSSSKISAVVSTSSEKDFSPFYKESSKVLFQKLWLPLQIDYPDLTTSSLNGFSNSSDVSSFTLTKPNQNPMSKNLQKIFSRSLPSLQPNTTVKESIMSTRKIRFFPDSDQKNFFNKCFGSTRYIYNKTLEQIKKEYDASNKKLDRQAKKGCIHMIKPTKSGSKTVKSIAKQCCQKLSTKYFCKRHEKCQFKRDFTLNFRYWRDKIIKKESELEDNENFLSEIPYDTRQLVIKNLLANYKSAISNYRNGNIKQFNLKFKSKRNQKQFINVDYRAFKEGGYLWKTRFNQPLKMRKGEKKWLKDYFQTHDLKKFNKRGTKEEDKIEKDKSTQLSDLVITKDYPNIYYLHIPYYKDVIDKKAKYNVVSVDPGVRTLHTFYSPDGVIGEIGKGLSDQLLKIHNRIDNLKSKITKMNVQDKCYKFSVKRFKRMRKLIRKRCAWLRTKANNIVKDYHWKAASYYCKNFENIIIPKLDTTSLIRKIKRTYYFKKGSDMIRKMMIISPNKLVDRIIYKASQYKRNVYVRTEEYTSMTCGCCGMLKRDLGTKKIYICMNCRAIIDRDVNGARNIMIKALS